MKEVKKPTDAVKYLLYLTPKQFKALNILKARRNRHLKRKDAYLTSLKELIGEALDIYIKETKIKKPRKAKAQTHKDESPCAQAQPVCLHEAQTPENHPDLSP
jgi:hypothetical protein